LAVHSVSYAPMPWNSVCKILDLESPFEAGSEEASEGGYETSE